MNYKDLELNLAQVETAIRNCRKKFSSKRKQDIYDNLIKLFNAVKSSNYTSFDISKLRFCRDNILHLVYIGVEFLHYKKVKDTPSHLVKCLEVALHDWLDDPNLFSVVFSHNNSIKDFYTFAVDESDLTAINLACRKYFGVEYDYGLIHISQPRFFKDDFLSSIPMYHELGHFVDANYSISKAVVRDRSFMPAIVDKGERLQLIDYVSEHFCDLFAAQYLGHSMAKVLNYYAYKHPKGENHPSTDERIQLIETFVTNSGTPQSIDLVNRIRAATKAQTLRKRTERDLVNRILPFNESPFSKDHPVKLSDIRQLHSLFAEGWEHYMSSKYFEGHYPDPYQRSTRINMLIKKSVEITFPQINNNSWATKLFGRWLM